MKYKIGVISPRFDLVGGGEKLILKLIEFLDKKKYTLKLYSPDFTAETLIYLSKNDIKFKTLQIDNLDGDRWDYSIEQYHKQIDHNDLYICNHIQLSHLRLRPKILYVHELLRLTHDNFFEEPMWDLFGAQNLENSHLARPRVKNFYSSNFSLKFKPDHIFVNSKMTKKNILDNYNISNISVLYPGCDKINKIIKKSSKKFNVLVLGVIAFHKRYSIVYELAKINKDINFHIVGRGPEFESCLNIFKSSLNVKIYSSVSENTLNNLWKITDCLLNLSIREPFGMNILEAASRRIPIITDKEAGVCEILGNNISKTDYSLREISKKLKDIKNGNYKKNNIIKSYNISKKYSWNNFTKKFEQKIYKILNKKKKKVKKLNSIIYRIDYPWLPHRRVDSEDLFNGLLPDLGYYNSSSEHIILKHFKEIKKRNFNQISFLFSNDLSWTQRPIYEYLLNICNNIERAINVSEINNLDLNFSFVFRESFNKDVKIFYKILTWIDSLNFQSSQIDNKKAVILLKEGESFNFVSRIKNHENIRFFSNVSNNHLSKNIFLIEELKEQKKINKSRNIRSNFFLLDSYNDFIGSKFTLEKKIKIY